MRNSTWIRRRLLTAAQLVLCFMFSGCSDWWTYNFSSPEKITVIPRVKLAKQIDIYMKCKEEEKEETAVKQSENGQKRQRPEGKVAECMTKALGGSTHSHSRDDFAELLTGQAQRIVMWQPSFCSLWEARSRPTINIEAVLEYDKTKLRKEFLNFYKNTRGKTRQENSSGGTGNDLCPDTRPNEKGAKPLDKSNAGDATTPEDGTQDGGDIGLYFANKLLEQIDDDHEGLLIGQEQLGKSLKTIREWEERCKGQCRAMTVSRANPAALSVSLNGPEPTKPEPNKPLFSDLQGEAQKAIIEDMLKKCDVKSTDKFCKGESPDRLKSLFSALRPIQEKDIEDFSPVQVIELTPSAILNSPDLMNRLQYIATYLLITPYPYPANGDVALEEEFWRRVAALQGPRQKNEREKSLAEDLQRADRDMAVRIENTETIATSVMLQEIASVTRKANQSLKLTVEPEIDLKGTVKGKLNKLFESSSDLETTVAEKLIKALDQRSTWFNPGRNMLRITMRGMEAINIAGTLKERVMLRVPPSSVPIPLLGISGNKMKIVKHLRKPLYSRITGLAISVAVVREPYKFKRSAEEKYGLPDSSDTYYVVATSYPSYLNIWQWPRILNALDMGDINVWLKGPPKVKDRKNYPRLRFYSLASNEGGPLYVDPDAASQLIERLRRGLMDLAKGDENKFYVSCKKTNKGGYYILVNGNGEIKEKGDPMNAIWVGKEKRSNDGLYDIAQFDWGDSPELEQQIKSSCS